MWCVALNPWQPTPWINQQRTWWLQKAENYLWAQSLMSPLQMPQSNWPQIFKLMLKKQKIVSANFALICIFSSEFGNKFCFFAQRVVDFFWVFFPAKFGKNLWAICFFIQFKITKFTFDISFLMPLKNQVKFKWMGFYLVSKKGNNYY